MRLPKMVNLISRLHHNRLLSRIFHTFSKMSLISVLEHIYDDKQAIREISRVIKQKGKVLSASNFSLFF